MNSAVAEIVRDIRKKTKATARSLAARIFAGEKPAPEEVAAVPLDQLGHEIKSLESQGQIEKLKAAAREADAEVTRLQGEKQEAMTEMAEIGKQLKPLRDRYLVLDHYVNIQSRFLLDDAKGASRRAWEKVGTAERSLKADQDRAAGREQERWSDLADCRPDDVLEIIDEATD